MEKEKRQIKQRFPENEEESGHEFELQQEMLHVDYYNGEVAIVECMCIECRHHWTGIGWVCNLKRIQLDGEGKCKDYDNVGIHGKKKIEQGR